MRAIKYIVICILISSAFQVRNMFAQDISSVYIDINAGNSNYELNLKNPPPTMGGIEDVLGFEQQDAEQVLERLSNYLKPILFDPATLDALNRAAEALSLNHENILPAGNSDRIDFLVLSPLLDAIEINENSESFKELENIWTDDLRGFALISLKSALRFGICVELGLKIINDQTPDPEILCERMGYGLINDWHYNESTGNGSFHVEDMKTNLYKLKANPDNIIEYELVQQRSQDWQIFIGSLNADSSGYFKAKRMELDDYIAAEASDSDVDPFEWIGGIAPTLSGSGGVVNLPTLPASAKNKTNGDIWPDQRDLNHRLFANGSSVNVISVEETLYDMRPVEESDDPDEIYVDPVTSNKFVRNIIVDGPGYLPPNNPLLLQSAKSCIDIMFNLEDGVFPQSYNDHPFNGQSFSTLSENKKLGWCLGRCPHPVIQNSR